MARRHTVPPRHSREALPVLYERKLFINEAAGM
jgi:hypothetical protein